jgi:hypothetical protein
MSLYEQITSSERAASNLVGAVSVAGPGGWSR